MSVLFGKWSADDIRAVIKSLDEKTGMNGSEIYISLKKSLDENNRTIGSYGRCFSFSRLYFDNPLFKDSAVIDVIRHEYCHYLVDELNLYEVFEDDDPHGMAWKTVCGILNTDREGIYIRYHFGTLTEDELLYMAYSNDIPQVDIMEQIERWGKNLPSLRERRDFEKSIAKKYSRARLFRPQDRIVHEKYGYGIVIDTFPTPKKQYLYVDFEDGENRKVQNCHSLKVVSGKIMNIRRQEKTAVYEREDEDGIPDVC